MSSNIDVGRLKKLNNNEVDDLLLSVYVMLVKSS